MPIFEYRCKKCNEIFEVLVRKDEKIVCPSCKSKRLEKLISTFNASAEKTSRRRNRSGSCAEGCCAGNSSKNVGCCGGCCCR